MDLLQYLEQNKSKIIQESEKLFIEEFLYPLLGSKIEYIIPQQPFIDNTGKNRKIDFAYIGSRNRLAFEVNGESYHAEGVIPDETFDDNLFRQNEILSAGYRMMRFSYHQLLSPQWRKIVQDTLRKFISQYAPELISEYSLKPTPLQKEALQAIDFYRNEQEWKKGVIILPTGTGKTILSAIDAKNYGGKVLFLVHRLDILKQSIDAYKKAWPDMKEGILTGESRDNEMDCDVLFASKDTLRQPTELEKFGRNWFSYIVVDEVHHGQCPTYREVLAYFQPSFMLGMTATPDRTDRKDILELFDYNKIYEIPLSEVIEKGYLVPYTYYGLTDNIDYSSIRYQNQKYRVDDLERYLIIPKRNQAILREYIEKGKGDKAIGFCVSINHAERMAEFFSDNGISAVAIHSNSTDRDKLISDFRNNEYQVAFTVDLFNEGIDFPNVQVLLFLRPTESKTVFLQQLGRGLRLCIGKDRVRILDFIGNYKRANQIRKYLSKSSQVTQIERNGRHYRKIEYTYSAGCEVLFDSTVEEILDRQDAQDLGITKEDLKEAYFALAEELGRKPSKTDLDNQGEYKSNYYIQLFGSWLGFLQEIGEYTEASYHYPQGVHLGHILSILYFFSRNNNREGTQFDDKFIRLRGDLGEGRISTYRRQVKYKILAAMELGILTDDRNYPNHEDYELQLTPLGKEFYQALKPLLNSLDLSFEQDNIGIYSTRMKLGSIEYNKAIQNHIKENKFSRNIVYKIFLSMPAVQQMLVFIYHIQRKREIMRDVIYQQFFKSPMVIQFCDQEGIEEATLEASRRRCPFILNILESCDLIDTMRDRIIVRKLLLTPWLVRPYRKEEKERSKSRLNSIANFINNPSSKILDEDTSIVRELFGPDFLTDNYYLKDIIIYED